MSMVRNHKIAVIAPSAPPLGGGGVASSHYHLYRCFRKLGLDCVLLTFNDCDCTGWENGILRFGASARLRSALSLGCALYLKALGSRKVAYHFYDIIASVPGVLRMNRALRELAPDHIIIPDHCGPGLFLDKGKARLTMVSHHNPARFEANPLLGDFCSIDVREALALEQRVLRKVDHVVAPSRYMEEVFADTFRFSGPVAMIHNPLDLCALDGIVKKDLRRELNLPPDSPMVYIPSAGSRFKGERFVAQIINRLAAAHPGMVGFYLSGNLTAELNAELEKVPANVRVYAPGHIDHADNLALVKSCSFGISPTLIENFGMAILEAGFCALPMVVFDVGGTAEIVSDGENGFCVPCPDVEQLSAAAVRLLDPGLCRTMGDRAYLLSRRRFDPGAIVQQYLQFMGIEDGQRET